MQFCRLGTVVTGVAFDEQLAVPKANFAWDRGVFFIVACLSSLGLSDLFIRYFMRTTRAHTLVPFKDYVFVVIRSTSFAFGDFSVAVDRSNKATTLATMLRQSGSARCVYLVI